MQPGCIECTYNKNINRYPKDADPALVREYQEKLRELLKTKSSEWVVPEMGSYIKQLRRDLFHEEEFDYSDIKRHFNDLLLDYEKQMAENIRNASDPMMLAVQYAMTGNYIDFAVLKVEEEKLFELISKAGEIHIDEAVYRQFLEEAAGAKRLTYITDNCGEIVTDKLLISELKRYNPDLEVTVLVRGAPVSNDATIEDALQVGMPSVARVMSNGTGMDGTILRALSEEARSNVHDADMLISKGQANYESLAGCGLNIFYLFICKCELFMNRFNVKQFGGILTRESLC